MIILWLMIIFSVLSALFTILEIGKPRKPITPGAAVGTIIITGLWVWGLLFLSGVL